jgi:hypothetical protein
MADKKTDCGCGCIESKEKNAKAAKEKKEAKKGK